MAFGKVSKQDLVDAGLDPDEIKNSISAIKDGSATKEDMTKVTTALDAITNSLKELETRSRPNPNPDPNPNPNPDPNAKKTSEELELERQNEFLTNPTAYVDKRVGNVVVGAQIEFKRMSRDLAWREGVKNLRGFKNPTLREEIEKEWAKYTPEIMARNNTDPELLLQQVHDMILGRHHDEIINDTNKRDGKFNLVHGGGSGGSGSVVSNTGGNTGNEGKTVLTDDDKLQAKKFGMTDEEWIAQMDDMTKEKQDRMAGMRR